MQKRDQCPECGSDAYNSYGRTANGKERRICLACDRQYVVEYSRLEVSNRPECPVCSQPMNVYMRQANITRYRCRNYPECREYVKIQG